MTIIEALRAAKESPGKVGAKRHDWPDRDAICVNDFGQFCRYFRRQGPRERNLLVRADGVLADDWETVELL